MEKSADRVKYICLSDSCKYRKYSMCIRQPCPFGKCITRAYTETQPNPKSAILSLMRHEAKGRHVRRRADAQKLS